MNGPFVDPTILMCPPDHYGIEYEINPWMQRSRQADHPRAVAEWNTLHDLLQSLGVRICLLEPVTGLPDLVFTANAGLIWKDKAFLARFRHVARQGETAIDEAWFVQAGFDPVPLPDNHHFEGAGDALFCGETLFAGYLIRSDAAAMQWVAGEMNCRVIPLQLVDDYYYHLDTCFCPLDESTALYYPAAFDSYARQTLQQHIPRLLEVNADEASRFACNAVVVGTHVVMNDGCPALEAILRQQGFTPHAVSLDEFIKAGGSAKCLTLRLDGEDAAVWPN